jgi:hypothetical protein
MVLPAGVLFPLLPGDVVTHAGATFTFAKDSTINLDKGDRVSLREDDVITDVRYPTPHYDPATKTETHTWPAKWSKLSENQWAYLAL